MTDRVSGSRAAKAFAITCALVLCVPAIGAIAGTGHAQESRAVEAGAPVGRMGAGIDAGTLIGGGDALGFLSRLEEASLAEGTRLPEAFEREVDLPRGSRDVRVSEDATVVGCIVDTPPDEAMREVQSLMAAKGWAEVPLGSVEGSTYVKFQGECTWTLVTCTQVGIATNVVYRCVCR